jgi:hypothetical protein
MVSPGLHFSLEKKDRVFAVFASILLPMQNISAQQLRAAFERAGLAPEVYERIQAELANEPQVSSGFEAAHVAYYLGALLIIGAMGWFITNAWDRLSGLTLSAIAILYGVVFGSIGFWLYRKAATRIPGGILTVVAVCMTPMAIYGIERQLGWWPSNVPGSYTRFHPYIDGSWVLMEAVTVLVAAIALRLVRFPFIAAPAAYALWYMSMDATALAFGTHWTYKQECHISVVFGLAMMLIAYLVDTQSELDFAFWFYLFGVLTFTGGLTLMGDGNQFGRAVYCVLHLAMIALAIILQRRVFLIFGALGVFIYLMGEAEGYFRNSFGFTIALTVIGTLFIAGGIGLKRNESELTRSLSPLIPERIRHRHSI